MMQRRIRPKQVIPVLKADAYNHGARRVVDYLYRKGVRFFAVSLLEEAIELKKVHDDIEVLIMGPIRPEDVHAVADHDLIFTLSRWAHFEAVKSLKRPVRFHLKLDTGMNRLGFKNVDDAVKIFEYAREDEHIQLEGVYTHFATADGDRAYYQTQKDAFEEHLEQLPYLPEMVHVSNTSSLMKYERNIPYTTHARMGIGLYGTSLEEEDYGLKPTFILETEVSAVKTLKKGDKVSYSITYEAPQDERIAVLSIGYADGLIRRNQGGDVWIKGKRHEIIGRICMDQTIIRIDDTVEAGDKVELIGSHIHIDEVAERLETINYEVFTLISKRVPKIYIE